MHLSKAASARHLHKEDFAHLKRMHAYIEIRGAHASHSHSQHREVHAVHALSPSSHVPEVAALLA
jgi:hypothetical protein